MPLYNPSKAVRGTPIRASDVNADRDEIARLGGLRAGSGLDARQGAGGLALTVIPSNGTVMGQLTSTLATGSWASPATATANLYEWTGAAWVTTGQSVTVYSAWALSSSIASGKKVGLFLRNGAYHVLTAEC